MKIQNFKVFIAESAKEKEPTVGKYDKHTGTKDDFPGKITLADQFTRSGKSLAQSLAAAAGLDIDDRWGGAKDFSFDNVALFDKRSSKTILKDALTGKYTFDALLKKIKSVYHK